MSDKYNELQDKLAELQSLSAKHADLIKQLSEAYRIKKVWPEAYKLGRGISLIRVRLGGTGTVPLTLNYYIARLDENGIKRDRKQITEHQWDYIHGLEKDTGAF